MLSEMHPDVARIAWRFNRLHHYVDYSPFKRNALIRTAEYAVPPGPNNYGMRLTQIK